MLQATWVARLGSGLMTAWDCVTLGQTLWSADIPTGQNLYEAPRQMHLLLLTRIMTAQPEKLLSG